jgi:hypothetical protein
MVRRLLVTLSLAVTVGLAVIGCNSNAGTSPTLAPTVAPAETPAESPASSESPLPSSS